MKNRIWKKIQIMILTAALALSNVGMNSMTAMAARCSEESYEFYGEYLEEAGDALTAIAEERDIMALVYLADSYPVLKEPGYDSEAAVTVLSGQQVLIKDFYLDDDAVFWMKVALEYNGEQYEGYVDRDHLAVADSRFLEWEAMYGLNMSFTTFALGEEAEGPKTYVDIEQFPESYRGALTALKEKHPTWTFVKMNTTLQWNDVIAGEMKSSRSLVYKTFPDWAKGELYDSGNWYYATEPAVKKYVDPRNGLTEENIFQFEQLTYNAENHTLEALDKILANTFMTSTKPAPGLALTYAQMFYYIGKEEGREVSPFHLAARVMQEQGAGTSPLISGTYPGFEGYYNYFNINATGTTNAEVIRKGLTYAKEHGWNNPYAAILGGADFISSGYIKKGQDTLYLQKFNVNPNGAYALYTHQYMQNISAPTTEGAKIYKLYESAGALESTFVFKIPVYENMPAEACGEPKPETPEPPVESLDIQVTIPQGYGETSLWLDGVEYTGKAAEGKITVTAPDKEAKTVVMYKYNASNVPTGMYVWSLKYENNAYTVTAEPELEDLLSYEGFSIRITGRSGIRFFTGIDVDLRGQLTSESGASGYKLKEYGTLVMEDSLRAKAPMIKGGNNVQSGMVYGKDAAGNLTDLVFETVNNRYHFVSVLVGLPASYYKTDLAFRGYIILEKEGKDVTLYGPAVARNIYQLADRFLQMGLYQEGSSAYNFLVQLKQDADALEEAKKETEEQKSSGDQENSEESGNSEQKSNEE
ncbi:MAG: hypothetical protein MJ114_00010 [Acetatifactor sp.]|nr:hypothetical protein [Acetatifactor sp.]